MPYRPPEPGAKIIIVGGGAFGLSTAYALSLKKKYDIWVFDRSSIPAPDAASNDINKIVRMDYADDTLYMQLMIEALPLWRQWNKERAEMGLSPVFHETGVLLFSSNGQFSDYERSSMKRIREAGYGHAIEEFTSPQSIINRFPQFKDAVANGFNIAYLNKQGGWCNSSEAIKHIYHKCVENGVHFVLGPEKGCLDDLCCDPSSPGRVIGIQTKDKQIHLGDRVILATGAWTPSLVDLGNRLVATGQTVVQFQIPEGMRKQFENMPVWAGDLSRTGYYGFAVNAEGKMKIGHHSRGYLYPGKNHISTPRTQTTNPSDTIPVKALRDVREFLAKFLPLTSSMDICYARVCWYCDAIDGHFLVTPHPDFENLIVASGDSGHGMKFVPILGFKISHVVEGIDSDYSRAWAWRDMPTKVTYDGLRAETFDQPQLNLCQEGSEDARMATPEELRAARARL